MGVTFVAPEQADDVHRIASGLSLENEFAKAGLSQRLRRAAVAAVAARAAGTTRGTPAAERGIRIARLG